MREKNPALLENYDRETYQPTGQPTNQLTDWLNEFPELPGFPLGQLIKHSRLEQTFIRKDLKFEKHNCYCCCCCCIHE